MEIDAILASQAQPVLLLCDLIMLLGESYYNKVLNNQNANYSLKATNYERSQEFSF